MKALELFCGDRLKHGLVQAQIGQHQRLDSLKVEADGRVVVAPLIRGGLTSVRPDGSGEEYVQLPDRSTTNLCFGGVDMRTAYVTLSATASW